MKRRILERSSRSRVTRSGGPSGHNVQVRTMNPEEEDDLRMLHVAVVFDNETKTYATDTYPILEFNYSPEGKTLEPISLLTHLRYDEEREDNVFMCIRDQRGMYRWRASGDGPKDSTFETIADFVKFLEDNEFVGTTGYQRAA